MPSARAVAALPMYDWPEIRPATDALWALVAEGLARRGLLAPERLDRGRTADEIWRDPRLVLSQTCGYPLAIQYRDVLRPVAAPVFGAAGCERGRYRSFVVAAKGSGIRDLAGADGRRLAVNAAHSQSGHNILRYELAAAGLAGLAFSKVVVTGAHRRSLQALAKGEADIAAIDCVCFALAARHDPAVVERVEIVAQTADAPALPYVTAAAASPQTAEAIREALAEAVASPAAETIRAALLLAGVEPVSLGDYDEIVAQERAATAASVARFA